MRQLIDKLFAKFGFTRIRKAYRVIDPTMRMVYVVWAHNRVELQIWMELASLDPESFVKEITPSEQFPLSAKVLSRHRLNDDREP